MKAIIKSIFEISLIISVYILLFISGYNLQQWMQPKQIEVKIHKYYDKDENMLCYYSNLGGMSCVWSMEDL